MKKLITCLAAGLLIVGSQSLQAQSTTTNSTPSITPGEKHQGATPEERKERMEHLLKALDLNPADIKSLSREDRQAKIKETAEKVVSDLKAKKTAGTLTAEGQKRLDFIEKYLAHAGHKKAAATTESN
jgi:hypothetical protein